MTKAMNTIQKRRRLIAVNDAAKALGRNRSTITRWCKSGFILAMKRRGPGGAQPWMVPATEVRRLGGAL